MSSRTCLGSTSPGFEPCVSYVAAVPQPCAQGGPLAGGPRDAGVGVVCDACEVQLMHLLDHKGALLAVVVRARHLRYRYRFRGISSRDCHPNPNPNPNPSPNPNPNPNPNQVPCSQVASPAATFAIGRPCKTLPRHEARAVTLAPTPTPTPTLTPALTLTPTLTPNPSQARATPCYCASLLRSPPTPAAYSCAYGWPNYSSRTRARYLDAAFSC